MILNLFLKLFVIIQGLGAASGLVYDNKDLYVISDDQAYVYHYDLKSKKQNAIELNTLIPANQIIKKNKPDFESIVLYDQKLYCLASGSKPSRNDMLVVNLQNKESERFDLSNLYNHLRGQFMVDEKDFNIEGFIYHNGYSYLFNRGNGNNKRNAIFKFKGLPHDADLSSVAFIEINLPVLNNHQTTFSDAIIVDDQIIYTATIEAKSDVVNDGEVKESIIGSIDLQTFNSGNYSIIANNQKIEGLTLKKKSKNYYYFLLCEDNDDDSKSSKIYEMRISKDLKLIK